MVIMHEYQAKMSGQGSFIARLPPPTSEYITWHACGDILHAFPSVVVITYAWRKPTITLTTPTG